MSETQSERKAKRQTTRMLDRYIDGRLGLIFDTTSANAGKLNRI